jgi:hypothetical protein
MNLIPLTLDPARQQLLRSAMHERSAAIANFWRALSLLPGRLQLSARPVQRPS